MKFCPKCKSLLVPKQGKLFCSCGYSLKSEIKFSRKLEKPKEIEVVDEDIEFGNDTIPVVCWNCNKKGVYVKVIFFRSDEAPLRMYKCKHCKKVWRSSK